MFDARIRRLIDPPLDRIGEALARPGRQRGDSRRLFPLFAWSFGGLCWLTTASRVAVAIEAFRIRQEVAAPPDECKPQQ